MQTMTDVAELTSSKAARKNQDGHHMATLPTTITASTAEWMTEGFGS
jgi:hypothetical protein